MTLRYIAYYLPQFHPFPENDSWWGKGFTEWTNVAKAAPLYPAHNQPRYPTDFGYYDLRVPETMLDQIDVAKESGIDAFCFHYYWFDGKRLMERPVDAFLADKAVDFPFCFCWANENWTRRWDAAEHEVLIAQSYGNGWEVRFIDSLLPYFRDPRYLRVDGKPLLVVYRPQHIPDARAAGRTWRARCREAGIGDIHIVNALVHGNNDYEQYEFDAGVEFPPHNMNYHGVNEILPTFDTYNGYAVEYGNVARDFLARDHSHKRIYRTVFPDWDNTARVKDRALIVLGSTVDNYERWLRGASSRTVVERAPDDQLVFINAWNEWAEGCYLEPDRRHGRGFLQATLRVKSGRSRVSDIFDAAPERLHYESERQRAEQAQHAAVDAAESDAEAAPTPSPAIELTEQVAVLATPEPGSLPPSLRVRVAHRLSSRPFAYNLVRSVYHVVRKLDPKRYQPQRQNATDSSNVPFQPRKLAEVSLDGISHRVQSLDGFITSSVDTVFTPFEKERLVPRYAPKMSIAGGTKNGDALRLMLSETAYDAYPLTVGKFFNSIAHPLGCAVVSSDGQLINETMRVYRFFNNVMKLEYLDDSEAGSYQVKPTQTFIDADVVVAFHRSQAFGHLIFDGLPVVLLLLDQVKSGKIRVLLPRRCPEWYSRILTAFGVHSHHCLILDDEDGNSYRFRSTIVSSGLTTFTTFFPHPAVDALMQVAGGQIAAERDTTAHRRLYLCRRPDSTFSGRAVLNDDQVEIALVARGFETVDPASLSYPEQVKLFRDAEIIVGSHGSAFANLVWAKSGTRVIDLMPDDWLNFSGASNGTVELWVARICALRDLRYEVLLGQSSRKGAWDKNYEIEMTVDVDLLLQMIDGEADARHNHTHDIKASA